MRYIVGDELLYNRKDAIAARAQSKLPTHMLRELRRERWQHGEGFGAGRYSEASARCHSNDSPIR